MDYVERIEMREIKFRAWVENARGGHMATQGGPDIETLPSFAHHYMWTDKYVLMQYTGLKDKNGVEIYEGDIVEKQGGKRGKIVFYAGGFFWEEKNTTMTPLAEFGWQAVSQYSVIGNIYESPELCGW